MYHKIEDQEKNPEKYHLQKIEQAYTEDECFDFISKPRQTQHTIGLYLKKIKEDENNPPKTDNVKPSEKCFEDSCIPDHAVENELTRRKGFWVDKPQVTAPLTYKIQEHYYVHVPKRDLKGSGAFIRPDFFELEYVKKLAKAGLLYPDEDEKTKSDTEEIVSNDECLALQKPKYVICDPCKELSAEKKTEVQQTGAKHIVAEKKPTRGRLHFKKIPSGCQCDYYGVHNVRPVVWDTWFQDSVDMLREHEMDKFLTPYRSELLRKNYEQHPPVRFTSQTGGKRTFPAYSMSNL